MKTITVPTYETSLARQPGHLRQPQEGPGLRPEPLRHLRTFRHGAGTYLALQNAKSSLSPRRAKYQPGGQPGEQLQPILAAHTALGKMVGFTPEQILEIRRGRASFDARLDALAKLVRHITLERGHADPALVQAFFAAGWTEGNLVDALMVVGDKMVSNFLHGATQIAVDFPPAPALNA
jgi:hypothetical protein